MSCGGACDPHPQRHRRAGPGWRCAGADRVRVVSSGTPWSAALDAQLRALWAAKLTTAEIGRQIGRSKGAVIGRAHRLGLPGRESPIKNGGLQPSKSPTQHSVGAVKRRVRRAPKIIAPGIAGDTRGYTRQDATKIAGQNGVGMLTAHMRQVSRIFRPAVTDAVGWDRFDDAIPVRTAPSGWTQRKPATPTGRITACTYIVSGERKSAVFCDAPSVPGRSYCPKHYARCCERRAA